MKDSWGRTLEELRREHEAIAREVLTPYSIAIATQTNNYFRNPPAYTKCRLPECNGLAPLRLEATGYCPQHEANLQSWLDAAKARKP